MNAPFRWNLARQEQLGRLVEHRSPAAAPDFLAEIQQCCVRILARAGDADLCFVGRSPENMFDYLSGILAGTSWAERCGLINISMRLWSLHDVRNIPQALPAIHAQLAAAGLAPDHIQRREHPVALVDLVLDGFTFGNLVDLWLDWARSEGIDPAAIRRRLRFIGITEQKKTSPKTWRWQQHAAWTRQFRPGMIKNISIDYFLWTYLADQQPKVQPSNPPWRWAADTREPIHNQKALEALQLALDLYRLGQSPEHRRAFARLMAREQTAMRAAWFRSLAGEIRG